MLMNQQINSVISLLSSFPSPPLIKSFFEDLKYNNKVRDLLLLLSHKMKQWNFITGENRSNFLNNLHIPKDKEFQIIETGIGLNTHS